MLVHKMIFVHSDAVTRREARVEMTSGITVAKERLKVKPKL